MKDYFSLKEKSCHCGCGLNLVDQNQDFLLALNTARALYGKPMIAESMTRCVRHNLEVGGTPGSAHQMGRAIDIKCTNPRDRFEMIMALISAGFRRFEIKPTDVHADMKQGAPNVLIIKTEGGLR